VDYLIIKIIELMSVPVRDTMAKVCKWGGNRMSVVIVFKRDFTE
jgi:hypothetical protein